MNSPYYSQRAVFASLWALFFHYSSVIFSRFSHPRVLRAGPAIPARRCGRWGWRWRAPHELRENFAWIWTDAAVLPRGCRRNTEMKTHFAVDVPPVAKKESVSNFFETDSHDNVNYIPYQLRYSRIISDTTSLKCGLTYLPAVMKIFLRGQMGMAVNLCPRVQLSRPVEGTTWSSIHCCCCCCWLISACVCVYSAGKHLAVLPDSAESRHPRGRYAAAGLPSHGQAASQHHLDPPGTMMPFRIQPVSDTIFGSIWISN